MNSEHVASTQKLFIFFLEDPSYILPFLLNNPRALSTYFGANHSPLYPSQPTRVYLVADLNVVSPHMLIPNACFPSYTPSTTRIDSPFNIPHLSGGPPFKVHGTGSISQSTPGDHFNDQGSQALGTQGTSSFHAPRNIQNPAPSESQGVHRICVSLEKAINSLESRLEHLGNQLGEFGANIPVLGERIMKLTAPDDKVKNIGHLKQSLARYDEILKMNINIITHLLSTSNIFTLKSY